MYGITKLLKDMEADGQGTYAQLKSGYYRLDPLAKQVFYKTQRRLLDNKKRLPIKIETGRNIRESKKHKQWAIHLLLENIKRRFTNKSKKNILKQVKKLKQETHQI